MTERIFSSDDCYREGWSAHFVLTRLPKRRAGPPHSWGFNITHDIKVLATHASTWVHRYSSLLQWSVPLGQRGHVAMVGRIPRLMVLSVGGSLAYFPRNARCTVTADLLEWYSNTQNDFSPGAAIFSLHTLASPSGRNVNHDEKQFTGENKFLSCSFCLYGFRKYVSYGFPIINCCNPGIRYKTPCITRCRKEATCMPDN